MPRTTGRIVAAQAPLPAAKRQKGLAMNYNVACCKCGTLGPERDSQCQAVAAAHAAGWTFDLRLVKQTEDTNQIEPGYICPACKPAAPKGVTL